MIKVIHNIKCGLEGIKNWIFVIWKDKQWDYYYFLKVILHKLDLMIKFREAKRHCQYVGDEKDLETMKMARDAIKRLIDDNYCFVYTDFNEADKAQARDMDIAFDTIKDNVFKWWD